MFESATTHAMIAVTDLDKARGFYGGTLGMTPYDVRPGPTGAAVRYESQGDTWFMVYETDSTEAAKSTRMRFEVTDIEVAVAELRSRGVVFEEYDLPGIKTVYGIATHESGARSAWFRDPDGNILQISQYW